jgi:hypothetical protein
MTPLHYCGHLSYSSSTGSSEPEHYPTTPSYCDFDRLKPNPEPPPRALHQSIINLDMTKLTLVECVRTCIHGSMLITPILDRAYEALMHIGYCMGVLRVVCSMREQLSNQVEYE